MTVALLIVHGLMGVALLGAITHQSISLLRRRVTSPDSFIARYRGVRAQTFTPAIVLLYGASVLIGAVLYPNYRLNVRISFEEMQLGWAVGLFELKEHFAGIGLGLLPLYWQTWRPASAHVARIDRLVVTLLLWFIVSWDFLIGHILNNIRGLE